MTAEKDQRFSDGRGKAEDIFPKSHFRISLRYKLAFPVLVLVLGSFAFILYTTFQVVSDMMMKYKEARLQTIAEVFSESLKIPLSEGNVKVLRSYIDLLSEQADVEEVRVEDANGELLGSSSLSGLAIPEFFHRYSQDFFGVEKITTDTYAAIAPIVRNEKKLGRLIIVFSKIEIEKELKKVFIERFHIASILAVFATLIIVVISWFVIRPLFVLQKTARNILAGDLEARARIHSMDEIQEVGDAFNKVVSRLVQSFDHLRLRTQALEESEEKYRSIVNDVSDIIFSITPEGELMLLNRGFSGYTREEILADGLPVFFSMHVSGEAQKFQDALEAIIRTKQPILHLNTKHFHRVHHTDIYYQTNMAPVIDYEGNIRLIQGVMRDITDIRRVEMMKETLVRDVAHELKTPTAKFIMLMQWFEKEMERSPEKNKYLPIIKMLAENADRLMRTISSIMDLSKIESGMADIRKQEIDLNDVLRLVVDDTKPLAFQHHLSVEAVLSVEPMKMFGDPDMLYRVFSNLVSNSIKFTPDGGKITVSSFRKGTDICVTVVDDGIGIERESLRKIFEAFYQNTPSSLGIGVGLTISKEIVLLHEGDIWAESEGPGRGSTFKVVFPAFEISNQKTL